MFIFGFTDMFMPHLFTNSLNIKLKSTTRDYPFDTSILHWTFLIPLQDRKFHELLLALDPSLKDWEIIRCLEIPRCLDMALMIWKQNVGNILGRETA
jgi:alpha-N-acetylglucosamine transferase